jgi:CelD/BcsL family acetyltransferase involved in cellulose biosynthesis
VLDQPTAAARPETGLPRRSELAVRLIRADEVGPLAGAIRALAASAGEANPHALPAALVAAGLRAGQGPVAAIATDADGMAHGVWPLRIMRAPPGLTVLKAPVDPAFDLSGGPLVRAGAERIVVRAMLAALRDDTALPRQMILRAMPADGACWQAILAAAAADALDVTPLARWERGLFDRRHWVAPADYFQAALSAARRKRLRQKEKALAGGGVLVDSRLCGESEVRRGLEAFVNLEAAGWKGHNGTALAQSPSDRAYVEAVMVGLARTGESFVEILSVDDAIVAAGLFIVQGDTAFFWKTAYDERLARHSPGILLDMALTRRLFADPAIRRLDTGTDDSVDPASMIWGERRTYLHAVVNLAPGALSGRLVVAAQIARAGLRRWRVARLRREAEVRSAGKPPR